MGGTWGATRRVPDATCCALSPRELHEASSALRNPSGRLPFLLGSSAGGRQPRSFGIWRGSSGAHLASPPAQALRVGGCSLQPPTSRDPVAWERALIYGVTVSSEPKDALLISERDSLYRRLLGCAMVAGAMLPKGP